MTDIENAYIAHAQDVYRYLYSLTHDADISEELTQETFFRAMRTIKSYDGRCKLRVWLCSIAKHMWYRHLAKNARYKRVELDDQPVTDCYRLPEEAAMQNADKTALYKAIHVLPDSMREVVHLRLTGEFSFAEIGEILGKTENWARVTFYRAKMKIAEELQ
ncbi:MAG: sigma-70 family RNA polymerase sigma factor [Defluviitaleaceae bacterium]|nr:sigma-70 family RNA polymerase sigma factor [Defluviitaleaceae bacterium]MCL2276077.1 sigma-70 family RNA polymerase sigma factor [Defluviitaleaceae bacterium]